MERILEKSVKVSDWIVWSCTFAVVILHVFLGHALINSYPYLESLISKLFRESGEELPETFLFAFSCARHFYRGFHVLRILPPLLIVGSVASALLIKKDAIRVATLISLFALYCLVILCYVVILSYIISTGGR
jgi:hypothetical protein